MPYRGTRRVDRLDSAWGRAYGRFTSRRDRSAAKRERPAPVRPRNLGAPSNVLRTVKALVAALLLSLVSVPSCTTQENQSTGPAISATPEADPSGAASSGGTTILVIKRSLPDGPLFVEGSAAHARVVDASGTVVVDEYFDLPELADAKHNFASRIRVELPPGQYRLVVNQRPCDPSACSQGNPETWRQPNSWCRVQLRLSAEQKFTATAVVRRESCLVKQRSEVGQLGG